MTFKVFGSLAPNLILFSGAGLGKSQADKVRSPSLDLLFGRKHLRQAALG